jgi:thiamine-monophosphate kinase
MTEFDLIKRFFHHRSGAPSIVLGVGDDCALLQPPEGEQLAISIDTLVAGVHFPADAEPAFIGERALRVALSDLGAMGAKPLWFTLALTLPEADENWLEAFSGGLMNAAGVYGCSLVGGDTTRGPLTISIQVHGSISPGRALRRDGARLDDLVYVTGDLGDGAAALAVINKELQVGNAANAYLMDRFYRPRPHIRTGELLAGVASSAIDISDGFLADLEHICNASKVGAAIDVRRLPVSEVVMAKATPAQRESWALGGGDDYQLCFTVPRKKAGLVQTWIDNKSLSATLVGKIVEQTGVRCFKDGRPYSAATGASARGYQHFGSH